MPPPEETWNLGQPRVKVKLTTLTKTQGALFFAGLSKGAVWQADFLAN